MRLRLVAVLLCAWASPSWAGAPHPGWPHAAPLEAAWHTAPAPRTGDGRLPRALIHGPRGPVETGAADRAAHRPSGVGTRRFPRPVWGGARLDWCLHGEAQCGPVVAQAFCRAHGFSRLVEAVQERAVGRYALTRQLGSARVCQGPECAGFARITCTRG